MVTPPKRLGRLVFYFSLPLLIIAVLHDPILTAYANWLAPSAESPEADIAVVVNSSQPRVDAGIQLLQDRKVKALFITAIPPKKLEALIVKHNLPRERVYWGGCSDITTTFDQPLKFLKTVVKDGKSSYRNIVLITNSYHLRRSLWIYRRTLGSDFKIKTFAVTDPREFRYKWWRYDAGRKWVSMETQKIIFYWIYYGLLGNTVTKDIPYHDYFNQKETTSRYSVDPAAYRAWCKGLGDKPI